LHKPDLHEPLRCPVCRAPWKDLPDCPRCGSDLAFLATIREKAHFHLDRAVWFAQHHEHTKALKHVEESLALFSTSRALALKITLLARLKQYGRMLRCIIEHAG